LAERPATLAAYVALDCRKGASERLRQHLQASVRIGFPEPYDLAVTDLAMRTGDPG
jgi:hypothetical protein